MQFIVRSVVQSSWSRLLFTVLISFACLVCHERPCPGIVGGGTTARGFEFALPRIGSQKHVGTEEVVRVASRQSDKASFTVVCFLGTECPLAKLYAARLEILSRKYQLQGVLFVGMMSNHQDSIEDIQRYIAETDATFPICKDVDSKVADHYAAERTPEVFLLDSQLNVLYRGRIDNQFQPGISRDKPTSNELEHAIDEALAGKPVTVPRADALGCRIGRVKPIDTNSSVTYARQIADVLNRNCVECHRPGEIGPFALTDYAEIVGWGDTIVESIDAGRMPPWHANPAHGEFVNARHMAESDKQLLRQWFAAGAPLGEMKKSQAATSKIESNTEPADATIAMREKPYRVPATGTVEYQYFVVDPKFKDDTWVSNVQILPGNRAVVHHAIVFIRPPDGGRFRGVGWLGAYVPGQRVMSFPSGHARLVPADSKLVFQMHYTPNGTPQDDLTKVALRIVPEREVTHEIFTLAALDQEFEIPPNASAHRVQASLDELPREGKLLSIEPHMHFRGAAFQVRSQSADNSQILLDVPRYDFNWQHSYVLAKPLSLEDVSHLEFTATFDNSTMNPFNPNPREYVTWGDQTWEEMAICFFEVAEPRAPQTEFVKTRGSSAQSSLSGPPSNDREKLVAQFVDEFFQKLDKNRDEIVVPSESPLAVRHFSFRQFDEDNNSIITRQEVQNVARRIYQLQ